MSTVADPKTVLVADDTELVRRVLALVLTHQGYRVLQASGGHHAVTIADGYTGEIDLLLTDVIMPDLTGREVAAQVLERRPETHVLFMSGQDQRVLHDVDLDPRITLLRKPLELDTLLAHVRRLVCGGRAC